MDICNYSKSIAARWGIDTACVLEIIREEVWQKRRVGSEPEILRSVSEWLRMLPWISRYRFTLVLKVLKDHNIVQLSKRNGKLLMMVNIQNEKSWFQK